jgi:hypothetical protein
MLGNSPSNTQLYDARAGFSKWSSFSRRIALIVVLVLTSTRPLMALDRELEARFRREAPQAWKNYLDQCRHLQGTSHLVMVNRNQGKAATTETHVTLLFSPPYSKFEGITPAGKELRVSNAKYAFTLNAKENGAWTVRDMRRGAIPVATLGDGPIGGQNAQSTAVRFVGHGLVLMATWLPRMFEERRRDSDTRNGGDGNQDPAGPYRGHCE